jgi:WD40 repeat protein
MARQLTLSLLVCMALSSCQTPGAASPPYVVGPDIPAHSVPVPPGHFFGLAWLADGTMVVGHTVDLHPWIGSTQVWQLRADGSGFARVPLPNDPACRVTEYLAPTPLHDGRAGLLKRCDDRQGAPATHPADDYAVAYSMTTGALEVLTPSLDHYPREISWDPTLQRAIAAQSSDIVASIFEIDRDGTRLLHLPIGDGNRVFWLDDSFHADPSSDADEARSGRADQPEWSPDGQTIAFLAEAQSIGVQGFARLKVPYDLYFMNPDGSHIRKVLPGVDSGVAWSPDSRYVAFDRQSGIWISRVGSKRAVRIASKSMDSIVWSPDGRSLAGIRSLHDDEDQQEIVLLDVQGVMQTLQ